MLERLNMDCAAAPLPAQTHLHVVLATVFRGKLCKTVLPRYPVATYPKGAVIYETGDQSRTLFFVREGLVKIETVTEDGHALVYDVRKTGDVAGELGAYKHARSDRAVALEPTSVTAVPFDAILEASRADPGLLDELVQLFCNALSSAYEQLNSVAFDGTVSRLVRVLVHLGKDLGHQTPQGTEISAHLTQEELAHMAAVSRERVSTAMNSLRAQGLLDYSRQGRIVLDLPRLEQHGADGHEPAGLSVEPGILQAK